MRRRGRPRKGIPEGYALDGSSRYSGVSSYSGRLVPVEIASHAARVANYPLFDEKGVTDIGNWFTRAFALADRVIAGAEDSLYGTHPHFRNTLLLNIWLASVLLSLIGPPALWLLAWTAGKIYHKAKRPTYYPAERARRLALAAERRKIRRRSTSNPMPSPEALLEQFAKAKSTPEEMIRFGSMLEDLECYVDNRLQFSDDGTIIGRNGGVKRWLQVNCPPLFDRYKTVMRYKQLSRKFRQALGLVDPMPAVAAFSHKDAKVILAEAGKTIKGLATALGTRLNPDFTASLPFPTTPNAEAGAG